MPGSEAQPALSPSPADVLENRLGFHQSPSQLFKSSRPHEEKSREVLNSS